MKTIVYYMRKYRMEYAKNYSYFLYKNLACDNNHPIHNIY